MGTVLLAHDPMLDRPVALKLPLMDSSDRPAALQRFYREGRAMAKVHHPHVCPIHDVGEFEGSPYLAMAYIEGRTLADEFAATGPLEPSRAAQLVRTLAFGIQAIHETGVAHRDLKPSNVMIRSGSPLDSGADTQGTRKLPGAALSQPIITDFGLASHDHQQVAELTQSGTVMGSPAYMAPEQVAGRRDEIGLRTDVYALGLILYEAVCEQRLYRGTGLEVLGQISAGTPPIRPSELVDLDPALEPSLYRRWRTRWKIALSPLRKWQPRSSRSLRWPTPSNHLDQYGRRHFPRARDQTDNIPVPLGCIGRRGWRRRLGRHRRRHRGVKSNVPQQRRTR